MNDSHPSYDRLIDFACRLLTELEAEGIRSHVRQCDACDRRLQVVVRDRDRLRSAPRPRYRHGRVVVARHNTVRRLGAGQRARAAAVSVAAVLVVALMTPRFTGPPRGQYWMPVELTPSHLRGMSVPLAEAYRKALDAYAAGDAKRSLALLEDVDFNGQRQDGLVTIARLMKASALLNMGESRSALEILDGIELELLPSPWRGRAGWLRYLSLREIGDDAAACSLLEWLSEEGGEISNRVRSELEGGACEN